VLKVVRMVIAEGRVVGRRRAVLEFDKGGLGGAHAEPAGGHMVLVRGRRPQPQHVGVLGQWLEGVPCAHAHGCRGGCVAAAATAATAAAGPPAGAAPGAAGPRPAAGPRASAASPERAADVREIQRGG